MHDKITKCVVTGGAGFIGSHIVDALVSRDVSVLVIDDLSTGYLNNLDGARNTSGRKLSIVVDDLLSGNVGAAFLEFKPDAVIHLAAQMNVRHSVKDPIFDAKVNVLGTLKMLDLSIQSNVRRFVFSSTGGAIYGEQEVFPAPETHKAQAESPYGVSKRAAELYMNYYARKRETVGEFSAISLRYGNVYGPRQNSKGEAGVIAIFCERALSGEKLIINGDGLQTRDYVFISDVVDANMAILFATDLLSYNVFNVGTGQERTVLDIVSEIRELMLGVGQFAYEHGATLPGEQRRSVIDASKLKHFCAWTPKVDFRSGIKATFDSFVKLKNM